jgi:ureidoglycolate hydrolase
MDLNTPNSRRRVNISRLHDRSIPERSLDMLTPLTLSVEPLDVNRFAAYGWMLGKPLEGQTGIPSFSSPESDFWREHLFDNGTPGQTEILWVTYRNTDEQVKSLEMHHLTQQAIVPLTAPVVQIVATSTSGGTPDPETLRAFFVPVGQGLCMGPRVWHTTRVPGGPAACLMLTRPSTTLDLAVHLKTGAPLCESVIQSIETVNVKMSEAGVAREQ